METVTSTKDKTRRNLKKDIEFNAEFLRSMNSIHSQYDGNNSYDSSDSLNTISDEIPVWVNGEQRWISGVNDDTTCSDLVNVLLNDEGISRIQNNITPKKLLTNPNKNTSTTTTTTTTTTPTTTITDNNITNISTINNTTSTENRGYVITERWRRVEQILNDDTKILQIWSAWGDAKSEVKLTLRQIDPNLSTDWMGAESYINNDKDSGMGSPNGSSNSAIIRRRKHRASKSTNAWITQAQTVHPKSQKSTIEKLMKLILEQGETIQQQLAKLRDRELQITKIEEERHKNREKEHGKNYLLETYLNGLPEVEVKEIVTVNSDSGVQTEGATSSPEISCSVSYNQNEDDTDYILKTILTPTITPTESASALPPPPTILLPQESQKLKGFTINYKEKSSHREKKLLKDHKQAKEFSSLLQQNENNNNNNAIVDSEKILSSTLLSSVDKLSPSTTIYSTVQNNNSIINPRKTGKYPFKNEEMVMMMEQQYSDDIIIETNIPEKIEWMEKLVAINKHLQREEELLVRLGAKIRKYETEKTTHLNENEIRNEIIKINTNIDFSNIEMNKIETDLHYSNEQFEQKTNILQKLNNELLLNSNNTNNDNSNIFDLNENFIIPENINVIGKKSSNDTETKTSETLSKVGITLEGNTINLNNDNLVENLYNFSQYILKPNYDFNTKNENFNRDDKQLTTTTTTSILPTGIEIDNQQSIIIPEQIQNKMYNINCNNRTVTSNLTLLNAYPPPPQGFESNLPDIITVQQQSISKRAPILNCKNLNPILRASTPIQNSVEIFPNVDSFVNPIVLQQSPLSASVNFLEKSNRNNNNCNTVLNKQIFTSNNVNNQQQQLLMYQQPQQQIHQQQQQYQTNMNIYSTTNRLSNISDVNGCIGSTSTTSKFGPKRMINGICNNEFESNSDTGLSSMGEDVLHLGTLV